MSPSQSLSISSFIHQRTRISVRIMSSQSLPFGVYPSGLLCLCGFIDVAESVFVIVKIEGLQRPRRLHRHNYQTHRTTVHARIDLGVVIVAILITVNPSPSRSWCHSTCIHWIILYRFIGGSRVRMIKDANRMRVSKSCIACVLYSGHFSCICI